MAYYLPLLLIFPTWLSYHLGGNWIGIVPVATYALIVLADRAIGKAKPSVEPASHWLHVLPTWLWVPIQLGMAAWILSGIHHGGMRLDDAAGLGVALGLASGGIGITDAHELIHRRAWWERLLGQVLLVSVSYHHFYIEHVYGHHRRAGTPADSVTARRSESLWQFLPRAIGRSFVSAWRLEAERLARTGRPAWTPRNRVLAGLAAEIALYAAILAYTGWLGIAFFAAQSAVAVFLLETINYVEHYGLERREIAPGVYERYRAEHAWDSTHRLSNWMLFNLPKHASHHLHPGRRHDALDYEPEAPRLPMGYPLALVLAAIPPLWFRVVDPLLPPSPAAPV